MSRRGRIPIPLPQGVDVKVVGRKLHVKGPKGTFDHELGSGISVSVDEGQLHVACDEDSRDGRRLHGLHRALISNCVVGVSNGFEKKLELIGVGFRAAVQGSVLDLQLGFSHPTRVDIPEGLSVAVEKNVLIKISGADRQKVGQFAAELRRIRPPEVYKGKGVRYSGEFVRKKVGKAGK